MKQAGGGNLRILHILTYSGKNGEYGGPVRVARELCSELRKRGYSTHIFSGASRGSEPKFENFTEESYEYVRQFSKKFRFSSMWSLKLMKRLNELIRSNDVVHIHFAREIIPFLAAFFSILNKKPFIAQTHGMIIQDQRRLVVFLDKFFTLPLLNRAQKILVLNQVEELQIGMMKLSAKTSILPNGITTDKLELKQANLGSKIIFCSRLEQRKGIDKFISLAAAHRNLGLQFEIYGPDGGELSFVQNEISKLNLESELFYKGALEPAEVSSILKSADLLVLPSTNEPFPMIVLESLAVGTPVLVLPSCGFAKILSDFDANFVVDSNDLSGLISGFGKVLENKFISSTPEEMRKFCEITFGIAPVVDQLIGVYNDIIHELELKSKPKDLLWLTNIPTPYRTPLWNLLSSRITFLLCTLNNSERSRHWNLKSELQNINRININTKPFYINAGEPIYFNALKVWRKISKENFRAIYIDGWESPAYFVIAFLVRLKKIKLIFGYRSTMDSHRFSNPFVNILRKRILNFGDFIVTSGESSSAALVNMGISRSKIVQIFNPVDVMTFFEFSKANQEMNQLGHRYLYVGQLIERKNVEQIISAFASIRDSLDTLTIAGQGESNKKLLDLILDLNLQESVSLVGHQTQLDLQRLYSRANTLVLASKSEVWGLVVNEALASGMHVVVTENCGVASFIHGMPGAYICQADSLALEEAMRDSKANWTGRIKNPLILNFTPERFVDALLDKCMISDK